MLRANGRSTHLKLPRKRRFIITISMLITSVQFLCSFKSIIPVVGNLDLSPLAAFAFMGFFESLIGINEKSLKESSLWGATS